MQELFQTEYPSLETAVEAFKAARNRLPTAHELKRLMACVNRRMAPVKQEEPISDGEHDEVVVNTLSNGPMTLRGKKTPPADESGDE